MITFSREYKSWPLSNRPHLNIIIVETKGLDLKDFAANAQITLEDWHGNDGPDCSVDDLSGTDFTLLLNEFSEFLGERVGL